MPSRIDIRPKRLTVLLAVALTIVNPHPVAAITWVIPDPLSAPPCIPTRKIPLLVSHRIDRGLQQLLVHQGRCAIESERLAVGGRNPAVEDLVILHDDSRPPINIGHIVEELIVPFFIGPRIRRWLGRWHTGAPVRSLRHWRMPSTSESTRIGNKLYLTRH